MSLSPCKMQKCPGDLMCRDMGRRHKIWRWFHEPYSSISGCRREARPERVEGSTTCWVRKASCCRRRQARTQVDIEEHRKNVFLGHISPVHSQCIIFLSVPVKGMSTTMSPQQ